MKKKIAIITCYHDPDYIRAKTLRSAFRAQKDVHVIEVKNRHRGLLRYPEITWKILRTKFRDKPDAFLLTFRGQEILPLALLASGRKPLWFDEFVVPIAYAKHEKHKKSPKILAFHAIARMGTPLYNFCLRRCKLIIADTPAHAELSARAAHINLSRYVALPVSTDESVFKPRTKVAKTEPFQIFYYSTGMQPLHGIDTVLAAAIELKDDPRFHFLLVGGKLPMRRAAAAAAKAGANIRYESWVPYADLPKVMLGSGLCLGGPFGGTRQAHHVITGKTYQSLACAAPTVVGESQATEPYFTHKHNALVIPQKDVHAMVKAFKWAYDHPKELREIGERGRRIYDKEFSAEALARKVEPIIASI